MPTRRHAPDFASALGVKWLGSARVLPYSIRHKLASYGSIQRRDRPASSAASLFLELLHARR